MNSVVRNTRNPVYDEDFTFYGLSMAEITAMSLHFVILSFDRYSRDDVIGEVILPLNDIDLSQIETQQVALCKQIQPRSLKVHSFYLAVLELYMDYKIFQMYRFVHKDGASYSFRCVGSRVRLD